MNPFLQKMDGTTTGVEGHAHLLVAESGGLVTLESPEAVMAEVGFRAEHISSLMREMFVEAGKHDCFWEPDNE
jgi:hypothetical protein